MEKSSFMKPVPGAKKVGDRCIIGQKKQKQKKAKKNPQKTTTLGISSKRSFM